MKDKYTLKDLKIAVINEDLEKLNQYANMQFEVNSLEEAEEMLHYIELAKNLIQKEKNRLLQEMRQIRKLKEYSKLS